MLAFSLKEKEQPWHFLFPRSSFACIPLPAFFKRRQPLLFRFGEQAGMREVFLPITFPPVFAFADWRNKSFITAPMRRCRSGPTFAS
jgi:hypothetical protein